MQSENSLVNYSVNSFWWFDPNAELGSWISVFMNYRASQHWQRILHGTAGVYGALWLFIRSVYTFLWVLEGYLWLLNYWKSLTLIHKLRWATIFNLLWQFVIKICIHLHIWLMDEWETLMRQWWNCSSVETFFGKARLWKLDIWLLLLLWCSGSYLCCSFYCWNVVVFLILISTWYF